MRPLANGGDGRDGHGRFLPGNRAAVGRGNPHADRVHAWRNALAATVTGDDLRAVIAKLVERAKAGERWAVCELLDRCLGKPDQALEASVAVPELTTSAVISACSVLVADREVEHRPGGRS